MILIFADDWEARVGRFDNNVEAFFQRLVSLQSDNLKTRNHNITHPLFGNIHNTFQHIAGVWIN